VIDRETTGRPALMVSQSDRPPAPQQPPTDLTRAQRRPWPGLAAQGAKQGIPNKPGTERSSKAGYEGKVIQSAANRGLYGVTTDSLGPLAMDARGLSVGSRPSRGAGKSGGLDAQPTRGGVEGRGRTGVFR